MIAPTHITFAEFVYLLILTSTVATLNIFNTIIIAIAAVLPDIDTRVSLVGRMVPFISKRIERRFGHRTVTHSALFVIALSIIAIPLCAVLSELGVYPAGSVTEGWTCFIIGYASHPFLDTMTVNGVKLFYPFSTVKCVFPLEVNHPHRYRVQTAGKIDKTLAIIFLIACIPTFIISHQGYERFIRTTQRNIEAAVRDYNEFSKNHIVHANVSGYSMLTKEDVNGTFEIVGALNPSTLVIKGNDGHLHTLGKEFQADFVADKIICIKGKPAYALIRNIDLSNQMLYQVLTFIDTLTENYFFGDLTTTDKISVPENIKLFSPITGSSNTIKFNYATYDDIKDYNLDYVFISKGIITVKTILPGKRSDDYQAHSISIPKPENYAQFTIILNPKESVSFLKQKGDTVSEKEIIARRNFAQFFQEQMQLNRDKILLLENQRESSVSDIDQKINNADKAASIDSLEYYNNLTMSKGGYIPDNTYNGSLLKWSKSKRNLSQLLTSKNTMIQKSRLEIDKLEVVNMQLLAKQKAAELQSEIRSTTNGIIVDVRQIYHNNKTQVTFIIKRLPLK